MVWVPVSTQFPKLTKSPAMSHNRSGPQRDNLVRVSVSTPEWTQSPEPFSFPAPPMPHDETQAADARSLH
ncbi:hypothetical protein DPMN_028127 [Dreissena polymorpha]|uniref:Uncharacterized protein n=1 Tax=Dreissena polymorpha TaxID=45954 RepID=A0A9D4LVM5_DREPO|nr:hypothetical protein DPMN_028098 [Dreissena polymorpha]KAH3865088.1 hypothetical protein DPMN_028127 [Dreissena polymorpha]